MADNNLKVVIDVSAPGAKDAFNDVSKSATAVNDALKQLGQQGVLNVGAINDAIGKLSLILRDTKDPRAIQNLSVAISALKDKVKDLPPEFEKVHVSSLRAGSSALNLTHTLGLLPAEASHASHGIESLFFAFEQMREQTGSTEGAFKGLLSSLGSSVGIALAITAFTFLIDKLSDADAGLEELQASFEAVKESIDDMNKSLKDTEADLDFLKDIGKLRAELAGKKGATLELIDLAQQKRNDQIIKDQLQEDLDGINKQIADAFAKINSFKNNGLLSSLGKSFDFGFTKDGLIPKSALEEADKSTKVFLETYNTLVTQRNTLNDKLAKNNQDTSKTVVKTAIETKKEEEDALKEREENYKKYLAQLKKDQDYEDALRKNQFDNLKKHFDQFSKLQLEVPSLDLQRLLGKDSLKALTATINVAANIKLDTLSTNFSQPVKEISSDLKKEVERLTKSNPILIKANTKVELSADEKAINDSIEAIKGVIEDAFKSGFTSLGEGIGEALAGGDIDKAFQSFVSALGGAVKSIGEQLIALGVAAVLAKQALKVLFANPILEIAAGVALVAVGSAIQSLIGTGLKGFSEGGFTGIGGTNDPAGIVHKGEFVIPANAVNKLGVGFLNNLSFGGHIPGFQSGGFVGGGAIKGSGIVLQIDGNSTIRGQDIITVYTAAVKSQSRLT